MPIPTNRELLRRHALSFVWAFVALTVPLLAHFGIRQGAALSERGAPPGTLLLALLLALPFTAAMTVPMAVLIAVLREFSRLGANGTLAAARQTRDGIRRLVIPVLGASAGIALFALIITAAVLPHSNSRLAALVAGHEVMKNDRTMSMGELRDAERASRAVADAASQRRAAAYELEFHKKLALPAACLALALVGIALVLRFPHGGMWMVVVASAMVLGLYYAMIIAGESLADRMVVSPFLAMWGANLGLVIVAALVGVGQARGPQSAEPSGVAVSG